MKCSVVIACYNNTDLIFEAIKSIEEQTYPEWEIVLVDDCSTDNTLEVLQKYILKSNLKERYTLVHLDTNGGVSKAKGTGVQYSKGDIIVICDHDDKLVSTALEEIVNAHQLYPNASIVYTQHYNCDHLLRPIELVESGQISYSDIIENKIGHLLTFKKHFYNLTEGYDSNFRVTDDKDIIYKLEEVGDVIFVQKPLYYFRISERGTSRGYEGFNKSRDEQLIAVKNAISRRKKTGFKPITNRDYNNFLAEHYISQTEGYILMRKPLGKAFFVSLIKAYYFQPTKNIYRKIKATLLLSRIKRLFIDDKGGV